MSSTLQRSNAGRTKRALQRLSICPCGYPVLHDDIAVGTVYLINLSTLRDGFFYRCGRCGVQHRNVRVVDAASVRNPTALFRPLPYELFERAS